MSASTGTSASDTGFAGAWPFTPMFRKVLLAQARNCDMGLLCPPSCAWHLFRHVEQAQDHPKRPVNFSAPGEVFHLLRSVSRAIKSLTSCQQIGIWMTHFEECANVSKSKSSCTTKPAHTFSYVTVRNCFMPHPAAYAMIQLGTSFKPTEACIVCYFTAQSL